MKLPRWDRLAGAAIGLLTCAALTYQGSQQALGPAPEAAQAQSVLGAGSPLAGFTLPAMRPGDHGDQCSAVVYKRPEAAQLRLYAADLAATRGLGTLIRLRVESGRLTSPGGAGCAHFAPGHTMFEGPLEAFPTTSASAANPIALAGSGDDEVAIRVSYTLLSSATNAAQGGTARLSLAYGIEAAAS